MTEQSEQKPQQKPQHYWVIHKLAWDGTWDNLTNSQRDAIYNDKEKDGYVMKQFLRRVEEKAQAFFEDPAFPWNQKHTFAYSYRRQ